MIARHCLESKFDSPTENDAKELKPEEAGHTLYFDEKPLNGKSLGGHQHALIGSDGCTGHVTVNGMRNKQVNTVIETIYGVIAYYQSYG